MECANFKKLFEKLYECKDNGTLLKLLQDHPLLSPEENWISIEHVQSIDILPSLNQNSAYRLANCLNNMLKLKEEVNDSVLPTDLQLLADGDLNSPTLTIYNTLLDVYDSERNSISISNCLLDLLNDEVGLEYFMVASFKFQKVYFSLIRKSSQKKNNLIEIFTPVENTPHFYINSSLDLSLHNVRSYSGTLIKLFSYNLPSNSRSVISRNLKATIEDFIFQIKNPFLIVDKKYRFPNDLRLVRVVTGKKNILDKTPNRYILKRWEKTQTSLKNGTVNITVYLLNYSIEKKLYKKSLQIIKRDIFKHKMSVIFTCDGIVKNFYTKSFFDNMGFKDIKDHLFIHLNCSCLNDMLKKDITTPVMNNDTYSYLNSLLGEIFIEYNAEFETFRKELKDFNKNN